MYVLGTEKFEDKMARHILKINCSPLMFTVLWFFLIFFLNQHVHTQKVSVSVCNYYYIRMENENENTNKEP